MPKLEDVFTEGPEDGGTSLDEFIQSVEESYAEDGETWETDPSELQSPRDTKILKDDAAVIFTTDNWGAITVTKDQILDLKRRGFRAAADLLFHPKHWRDTERSRGEDLVMAGVDGQVTPKTREALEFGVKIRYWTPEEAEDAAAKFKGSP
jgi:hypothetical protein